MAVAEVTLKLAAVPLNRTAVAPVKFLPLIVTTVPTGPLAGEKPVITGATTNVAALVAVPPAVVTLSAPVVAPTGTVVWIAVADVTVYVAAVPLNFTADVPVKLAPLIVTLAPSAPFPGEKLVIVGTGTKFVALVAVPPGAVTRSGPVDATAGTVAWMAVSDVTVNVAALAPLNVTADAAVKFRPLIVTTVPTGPLAGAKLVIVGATMKLVALVAVPPDVVAVIVPLVAPTGTVV